MATSTASSKVKSGGFRAFLKKSFHVHSAEPDKTAPSDKDTEKSPDQHPDSASTPAETNTQKTPSTENSDAGVKEGGGQGSLSHAQSGKTRLLQAKTQLEVAAATLNKAMSKLSGQLQVPEVIGLQNMKEIDSIEATAKDIEAAIDNFIDARKIKLSTADSREIWKNCVKGWYMATFPYVKPCLDAIGVMTLPRLYIPMS